MNGERVSVAGSCGIDRHAPGQHRQNTDKTPGTSGGAAGDRRASPGNPQSGRRDVGRRQLRTMRCGTLMAAIWGSCWYASGAWIG